ncbi:phosphate transporter [Naegleria gruberi]|uniref:Phosphate transporter n=1 Tax=Naegleria gruberi TaxID=5762 RepID=D2V6Y5_NAEGR|nr:phosphate transporter [Naegleria gruberi]EFC47531.1 phosphate transporter [Naegleria gruberi]|eukprot:XP_002680275.1 phosphate transporter [Naegleria gruberi strain NEG-M]
MLWIVIVSGITSFVLSCGMGANDVANSFGTVVGSKTLSMKWAIVIASIFEFLGAMGDYVSGTLRTGIIVEGFFQPGEETFYMIGMMCVLLGPTIWLIFSTYLSLPVSTTHAVVGGICGFVISLKGYKAIQWMTIGRIALSWVVSPILGGIASAPLYFVIKKFILQGNVEKRTLIFFPIITAITVTMVFGSLFIEGSPALYLDRVPLAASIPTTIGVGIIVGIVCACFIPLIKRQLHKRAIKKAIEKQHEQQAKHETGEVDIAQSLTTETEMNNTVANLENVDNINEKNSTVVGESSYGSLEDEDELEKNDITKVAEENNENVEETTKYFDSHEMTIETQKENSDVIYKGLMIFCASLTSFSHGANDVSNAVGPFSAIYSVYVQGHLKVDAFVPYWILFIGAAGIVVGLAAFGSRVIKTVGNNLNKKQLVPSQGFSSQLCGASFVLIASKMGIPVSTTNALVGAVIGVGIVEDFSGVKWKLLGEVVIGWLTTLPISAILSAAMFSFLKWLVI